MRTKASKKTIRKTPYKNRRALTLYKRPAKPVNRTTVNAGLGFPKKMVMTHKYSEIVVPTCTGGALYTYSFLCNGLYDPNASGVGHQPYYFDQMGALYDHYIVIGSEITVKFTHLVTTNYASIVGCYINDDSTVTPVSITPLLENSNVKHRMLAAGQTQPSVFKLKWSAKKAFGKSVLANSELKGSTSANPLETQSFTFFVQPTDLITTQSYNVEVDIKYIAVWCELKDIAGS